MGKSSGVRGGCRVGLEKWAASVPEGSPRSWQNCGIYSQKGGRQQEALSKEATRSGFGLKKITGVARV